MKTNGRDVWRRLASGLFTALVGALLAAPTPAGAAGSCPAKQPEPLVPKDLELCARLEKDVRRPGAFPLHVYEAKLETYLRAYCHRNEAKGWRPDKMVRDTGPFVASENAGKEGKAFGTHWPVVVWYSPEMIGWMRKARAEGEAAPAAKDEPLPDGAMMIKEMFPAPASLCAEHKVTDLAPTKGAAVMVRDAKFAHDGWFWGWFGWGKDESGAPEWLADWPAQKTNPYPNMGFGQYCLNCHASARDNQTFASLRNVRDEKGWPLVYLSQDQVPEADIPSQHELVTEVSTPNPKIDVPGAGARFMESIGLGATALPKLLEVREMPRSTYDNVWPRPKGSAHTTFVTSDQCIGCHDAGGTGLQFDMSERMPGQKLRANVSPYSTWRTSPMGMAGRDPIFFAQLASEVDTLHPKSKPLVEDTCLGCHGVLGQRAFRADAKRDAKVCRTMSRDKIEAIPFPDGNDAFGALADYAGLARDGVSCVVCHRMAIGEAAAKHHGEPQNACLDERRHDLTPEFKGLAATFTGSFDLGPADTINGPFKEPKELPMKHALGMTPAYSKDVRSSELCGTCHTVHLPILRDGERIGFTYEQTTYAEWAFSAYRTGTTPDGVAYGKGELAQSCQGCHMPSLDKDRHPIRSKIASIQEYSNFPQAENNLGPKEIDLPVREGFAKHTLVGLNTIFIEMAQQYPDMLGVRVHDPMMPKTSIEPLALTKMAMLDQRKRTADVEVTDLKFDGTNLDAVVKVTNQTGHKFPSGVGFRRAFLEFTVRDVTGKVLWASGRTNEAGVIMNGDQGKPLDGELWWKPDCSAHLDPQGQHYQPHHERITRQDEVQIYEDLAAKPAPGAKCSASLVMKHGELTTSFLSRCAKVKDNRILPAGFLGEKDRAKIAAQLGDTGDLAIEAGPHAVEGDADYVTGGGDSLAYHVAFTGGGKPATVEATLYYQPTPPYYLQDRVCTSKSDDTKRLMYIAANLDLSKGDTASWKLRVAGSGPRPVPEAPKPLSR